MLLSAISSPIVPSPSRIQSCSDNMNAGWRHHFEGYTRAFSLLRVFFPPDQIQKFWRLSNTGIHCHLMRRQNGVFSELNLIFFRLLCWSSVGVLLTGNSRMCQSEQYTSYCYVTHCSCLEGLEIVLWCSQMLQNSLLESKWMSFPHGASDHVVQCLSLSVLATVLQSSRDCKASLAVGGIVRPLWWQLLFLFHHEHHFSHDLPLKLSTLQTEFHEIGMPFALAFVKVCKPLSV